MQRKIKNNSTKFIPIVESAIGYEFINKEILLQALTHRSFTNEHREAPNNERLEFLGDAILQYVATNTLYTTYPESDEGGLTVYRSLLVKTEFLAQAAERLSIEPYLRVSAGQRKEMERVNTSVLADVIEALIGAIHLDGGLMPTEKFIHAHLLVNIESYLKEVPFQDPKTALQEHVQQESGVTPEYIVLREGGPDHDKDFTVGVKIAGEIIAEAMGKSKQEAAQKAAEKAAKKVIATQKDSPFPSGTLKK